MLISVAGRETAQAWLHRLGARQCGDREWLEHQVVGSAALLRGGAD